ncbi:1371_t:CDS:10 [Ambispora gerdemannii]|uniref:1371_t:CDS:1 n=1 Tax=Ambispora gerdemannii TaxID=144530 RepID=A0A9N8ZST6_9GLOM|nr:1371_t:CDS:10 [Ambispora gerdemannii]
MFVGSFSYAKNTTLRALPHVFAASKKRYVPPKNNGRLQIAANSYEVIFDGERNNGAVLQTQEQQQSQEQREKEQETKQITILFAHANGFHKEVWEPVINKLAQENLFDSWNLKMWAMDCYNSGDSAVLNGRFLPDSFNWKDYALDLLSVIDEAKLQKPLIGVGHSLGGILAETLRPGTFSSIVTVEPVIYPASANKDPGYGWASKRKDIWENKEEASKFFHSKPFYKEWNPHALELHIKYGLRELPNGQVTLKCPKLQEHATDLVSFSECFEALSIIKIPLLYIAGEKSDLNDQKTRELNTSKLLFGELAVVSDARHLVQNTSTQHHSLLRENETTPYPNNHRYARSSLTPLQERLPRYTPSFSLPPRYSRLDPMSEMMAIRKQSHYKILQNEIIRDDGRIFHFYLANPGDEYDDSQIWSERLIIETIEEKFIKINNDHVSLERSKSKLCGRRKMKFLFGGSEWRWISEGNRFIFQAVFRNPCNEKEIWPLGHLEKCSRSLVFCQGRLCTMYMIDELEIIVLMTALLLTVDKEKIIKGKLSKWSRRLINSRNDINQHNEDVNAKLA